MVHVSTLKKLCFKASIGLCSTNIIVNVALCNRADHYIFALWFLLLSFFSSSNLSHCRLDVYHTSTHGVALV